MLPTGYNFQMQMRKRGVTVKQIETIHQYGRVYSEEPSWVRRGSRAFIVDGGKILLSHEMNTGVYLIPGGGAEGDETAAECCAREISEETGFEVRIAEEILEIQEHFYERLYISRYFICEITGKGEQKLTETEVEHGVVPEWVEIEKALEIFGSYGDYAETDDEIEGQYCREYTAIKYFLDYNSSSAL